MSRTHNYIKGVASGYVATIATVVVALWLTPFTLRFLDREEYAIFTLASDVLMWLGLLDIGITAGLNVQAAQLSGKPDRERLNRLASTAFYAQNVVVLGILIIGGVIVLGFPYFFSVRASLHRTTSTVVLVLVLASAIGFSTRTFSSLLIANRQMHIDNLIKILLVVLRTTITVVLLLLGWRLYSLAIASLSATVITSALAVFRIYRLLPGLQISRRLASWDVFRSIGSLGVWFSLGSLASLVISSLARIVAAKTISVEAVTTLTLTGRVYALCGGLLNQMASTALPMLGQLLGQDKKAQAERVLRQMFTVSTGLALVAATSIWSGNQAFVCRWVGAHNFGGSLLSLAFALSLVSSSWIFPHYVALSSALIARPQTLCRFAEAVANLSASLVLCRYFGLLGIVLGTFFGNLLTSFWYVPSLTTRYFGRPWSAYLRQDALPLLLVGVLLIPVAYIANLVSNHVGGFPGAMLGGAVSGSFGLGLLWAIAFDRSTCSRLIEAISKSRKALLGSVAFAASRG